MHDVSISAPMATGSQSQPSCSGTHTATSGGPASARHAKPAGHATDPSHVVAQKAP